MGVLAQAEPTADDLWNELQALSPAARDRFLERIVADSAPRAELEDLLDLAIARERAHEPVRPLRDVLAEIQK